MNLMIKVSCNHYLYKRRHKQLSEADFEGARLNAARLLQLVYSLSRHFKVCHGSRHVYGCSPHSFQQMQLYATPWRTESSFHQKRPCDVCFCELGRVLVHHHLPQDRWAKQKVTGGSEIHRSNIVTQGTDKSLQRVSNLIYFK